MHNRSIVVAVSLFVLIIIGMFIFAYLKKSELTVPQTPITEVPAVDPYAYIDRIEAKHFFIDGTHTLTGTVMMPTACELLNWDSRVAESMPEQVTVAFTIINTESNACDAVLTPARFLVSFDASESATMSATMNGRSVELNLVPALPGETPDDFELFIKG